MRLDFRHTKRALAEYERRRKELEASVDAAKTNAEVMQWVRDTIVAVNGVREAFFLDTSNTNSWDVCQHISVSHARRCVELYAEEKHADQH